MSEIRFSSNWNGKLFNECFTTFRLRNQKKYAIGSEHDIIHMKGNTPIGKFKATVVLAIPCKLADVPEILCYLDTGYSKDEFISIVQKMYVKYNLDYESQLWAFYLLRKVKG